MKHAYVGELAQPASHYSCRQITTTTFTVAYLSMGEDMPNPFGKKS
jgi:hypothetical protein